MDTIHSVDTVNAISHCQCAISDACIQGRVTLVEVPSQAVGEVAQGAKSTVVEAIAIFKETQRQTTDETSIRKDTIERTLEFKVLLVNGNLVDASLKLTYKYHDPGLNVN